ncbi:MAG: chemotaxis protein CheR, partial [Myxococcales bacterium]|nr:chemotaxis protein CheR [Myxococcales bacterium]
MTPIDAADVERFRALLGQLLGLASERDTVEPLEVVLRERVAATRAGDVRAYLSGLESGALAGEGRALATRVTIGETYFHRHPTSLRAFVSAVVPDRVAARAGERTLSILSAGCSTGAEPYTLAMLVRELPELAGWDVRIRGVDIDADAIEQARRGRFSTWQLREMAPEAQARWFTPRGPREVELDPAIRGMVDFEVRNLVEPDPAFFRPGAFDVIFCRN